MPLTEQIYNRIFNKNELLVIKEFFSDRDEVLGNNTVLDKKYNTGWTGQCGELTFKDMLEEWYGMEEGQNFIHKNQKTVKDDCDFVIKKLKIDIKIDVKTIAQNVDPEKHHYMNVAAKQLRKNQIFKYVNTYAFATYNLESNICRIVGYLTLPEFEKKSKLIKEGQQLTETFKPNTDTYCSTIEQLKPFFNKKA